MDYEYIIQIVRKISGIRKGCRYMNKKRWMVMAVIGCILFFSNTFYTKAATAEEFKNRWYDTHDYPLNQGSEDWGTYDMTTTLESMNPPWDLLLSMSTEEIAGLILRYPFITQITTYYGDDGGPDYEMFFDFCEEQSNIFYELLRRDDGVTSLLKAYQNSGYDGNTEKMYESYEETNKWYAEIFGSQFICFYADHFTEEECELANRIIEEKNKVYSQMDSAMTFDLNLSPVMPANNAQTGEVRTNYLTEEGVKEREKEIEEARQKMQSQDAQDDIPEARESSTDGTEAEDVYDAGASTQSNDNSMGKNILLFSIIGIAVIGGVTLYCFRKH